MCKDQVAFPLAVMALAGAALACSLPAVATLAPTPTCTVQPTPTAALLQATPLPVEPANTLEAQLEAVYDALLLVQRRAGCG